MTLREVEEGAWPFNLPRKIIARTPEASLVQDQKYLVVYGPGPLGPGSMTADLPLFKYGSDVRYRLLDLVREHLDRMGESTPLRPGNYEIPIRVNVGVPLYTEVDGLRQDVRVLEVRVFLTIHQSRLAVFSSYVRASQ